MIEETKGMGSACSDDDCTQFVVWGLSEDVPGFAHSRVLAIGSRCIFAPDLRNYEFELRNGLPKRAERPEFNGGSKPV